GGIGRRTGLKIPRPHRRAGSIPALGTNMHGTEAQVFAARAVPSLSSIGTYRLEFRGHGIRNLAESLLSPLHGARGNFPARGNTGTCLGRLRYGCVRTWAREL